MRYFFDCEFVERGHKHPIELISIGMVAEDGREFYAVNRDFKPRHASAWVRENVLPLLPEPPTWWAPYHGREWMPYDRIGDELRGFVGQDVYPEFWTYYGAYDYVLLSQLMGGMASWPHGWPYYAHDLRQWLDDVELHDIQQPDAAPHDALEDARWIRAAYLKHRGAVEERS